jgi:hypothetical protein
MTTRDVAEIFGEEIERAGGRVRDPFDDGERYVARGVLPGVRDVRPGDGIQGGVAVMMAAGEVRVHPYTFRQVCTNGAILAHAVQTRRVVVPEWPAEVEVARWEVREAVRACASPEAFAAGAGEMRGALEREADLALGLIPFLARLSPAQRDGLLPLILGRYGEEGGGTQFALMNAVTSVARDTADPELRWRLEEFGGGVPVMAAARRPRRPRGVVREVVRDEVEVGV